MGMMVAAVAPHAAASAVSTSSSSAEMG
jgi:hypothetical protein